MSCTFSISGDNGGPVNVIPPGRYQVVVTSPVPFGEPDLSDVTDPNYSCGGSLSFHLTGPGVSLHTNLEGGGDPSDEFEATFQAGTYVAVEDRRAALTRTVFSVSSGATSTGGGVAGGGGSGGASPSGNSNAAIPTVGNPSRKPAPVANLQAFRGSLAASVSTSGKPALTFKGKAVLFLKAGRYTVTVRDQAKTTGFTLQRVGNPAVSVTKPPFVGSKTMTVTLSPGQWVFYSAPKSKSYFGVTA
jgi:hypothetical protein